MELPMSRLQLRTLPGYAWPPLPDAALSQVWVAYQELERTQWLPPDELARRQLQQVRALLAHAVVHVPYYREALPAAGVTPGTIQSQEDFRRLPILPRKTYQERHTEFCAEELPPGTIAAGHVMSSGSSGIPVRVPQTNLVNLWWCACFLRDLDWCGIDLSGTLAAIRTTKATGSERERLLQGVSMPHWLPQLAGLIDTGPSFLMDLGQEPRRQLHWLRQIAPDYLVTFASNLAVLADLALEEGPIPYLRGIQTISEHLSDEVRARAETAFGVPIKDTYSCVEAGYLASPCPLGHGLHVHAENVLLEVLDETGRPCGPAQTGRVFITTLHNFQTPFVRYELMDDVTLGPGPCPCGRGLPLLTRVLGKQRPRFSLRDGRQKSSVDLVVALEKIAGIRQFQVTQSALDQVVVRVAAGPAWSAEEASRVRRHVADFFEGQAQVGLVVTDRIAPPPSGKLQCMVNELSK
jgi:phenylacetate-CoA ligase